MTKKLIIIFFFCAFVIYFPSLFTFFTNDDFFHLKISRAGSYSDFLNFFNFIKAPEGFGFYRPLTTQVFYFLGVKIFNLNPLPLHVLAFAAFFGGAHLSYQLALTLSGKVQVAVITCFLYIFSAIHFGHMYFLGTFQELGLLLFFASSALSFTKFLKNPIKQKYFSALTFFVLALLSKETAAVLPGVLFLIWVYLKMLGVNVISVKKLMKSLLPFMLILALYLYVHVYFYGLITGDSYFTDFSVKKTLNSLMWYVLWTLGVPEMFVDFIGPGIRINPNLFKFWAKEALTIFGLFTIFVFLLSVSVVKPLKTSNIKKFFYTVSFSFLFFVITLLPVLFFPFHKFSYNLTLPSFGIFFVIANILVNAKLHRYLVYFCLSIFIFLNLATLNLTKKTHWIVRGAETAKRVNKYFYENKESLKGKTVVFYDDTEDAVLPWSPTNLVNGVLSNRNFFDVFYPGQFHVIYGQKKDGTNVVYVRSRMFIGY